MLLIEFNKAQRLQFLAALANWMNEWMAQRFDRWVSEWMNEWMDGRGEWMDGFVNKWASEGVIDWLVHDCNDVAPFQITQNILCLDRNNIFGTFAFELLLEFAGLIGHLLYCYLWATKLYSKSITITVINEHVFKIFQSQRVLKKIYVLEIFPCQRIL